MSGTSKFRVMPAPEAAGLVVTEAALHQPRRRRMSRRSRILFFLSAWLVVLMPFLFWWNTWFGRSLSEKQLGEYLHDEKHPRHIQHALVQIGERMSRRDPGVAQWYPQLVRLAFHPVEEVRNTDAWVMGQDTSSPGFHQALLNMLADPSATVRGNAALSLVHFGDATGRPEILALLESARVFAPEPGEVLDAALPGTVVHQKGVILKLQTGARTLEARSPITGRLRAVFAHKGERVPRGAELAVVDPGTEQVWEALRALFIVGKPEDLPAVLRYERELPDVPEHVRQQARATEQNIRRSMNHERGGSQD